MRVLLIVGLLPSPGGLSTATFRIARAMLIPQPRERFLDHVFNRYLLNPLARLKNILSEEFLEQFFPEFRESFLASFEAVDGYACNVQLFELWDMRCTLKTCIYASRREFVSWGKKLQS